MFILLKLHPGSIVCNVKIISKKMKILGIQKWYKYAITTHSEYKCVSLTSEIHVQGIYHNKHKYGTYSNSSWALLSASDC